MEIKVTITGDEEQMEVNISHDLFFAADYCYGGCALKDVPGSVEEALEDIVAEILKLQAMPEEERTQDVADDLWEKQQFAEMTEEQRAAYDRWSTECGASAKAHEEEGA